MKIDFTILAVQHTSAEEFAGASNGKTWFEAVRQVADRLDRGLLSVDFGGVRIATVSWLREGLIALQKYLSIMRPEIIMVVANLAPLVREELEVGLNATGRVMIVGEQDNHGNLKNPVILGRLDSALRETLTAVRGLREFDAVAVSRSVKNLGLSAANNRLMALQVRGILKSERRGRGRVYQPVLEELSYGN